MINLILVHWKLIKLKEVNAYFTDYQSITFKKIKKTMFYLNKALIISQPYLAISMRKNLKRKKIKGKVIKILMNKNLQIHYFEKSMD